MNDVLIKASDLGIGWSQNMLLEHASFEIARGEIFVVLGGSGSGKSTLLRVLIGLDRPLKGEVLIDGKPTRMAVGKPEFGVMFQSGALLGSLTVGENLALPIAAWTELPDEAVSAVVQAKLRLVGLGGTEDKLPSELSGGMRKRAAIARAMALEPSLLFLDEPSAGLDPVIAAQLDELIVTLNEKLGITVVVVTHDLDSILKIGKRCIMLDRASKRIIAVGDPRELRSQSADPRVHAFFHRLPGASS